MKCVVHIGTEKTGSTSIQAFFDTNRSKLRDLGYFYTETTGKTTNRKLSLAAYNSSRRDEYTKRLGLHSDEDVKKYQRKIVSRLRKELRGVSSTDTVVFSSEHCHSRLRAEEEVERLKRVLEDLGFTEIQIIIYLRDQVEAISSLFSTAVLKGGRVSPPPRPFEEEYWTNLCDHKASVERFEKVFGSSSINVRLFCREALRGGSVLDDFLTVLGVEVGCSSLVVPERKNIGVSAVGLEIMRRVNRQLPSFGGQRKIAPYRLRLESLFRSAFSVGEKFRISESLAQEYREAFRGSNDWVRERYFPERESLFAPPSLTSECRVSLEGTEVDAISELVGFLVEGGRRGDFLSKSNFILLPLRRVLTGIRNAVASLSRD